MAQGEHINPEVLKWARETAGLTVAEAAARLGLKDSAKASAVEKLQGLEDGKRDGPQPRCRRPLPSIVGR
jgi:hypothetical protein